ncbi:hypothetical protein [Arcanobacterium pinnipediorum]|uniref:DUF2236 domain-containing protein n=1 Tax=Arcanobacterium pinnipediorum TaxID=1503041 RepID=A0ABY5AFZ1_9ACTO|nr:hypothetical protein [Arcanobacterium pinnipediorum]USR78792.1 hypothetical protein NG665_05195 [Arcanobacterium pinnipediorum]
MAIFGWRRKSPEYQAREQEIRALLDALPPLTRHQDDFFDLGAKQAAQAWMAGDFDAVDSIYNSLVGLDRPRFLIDFHFLIKPVPPEHLAAAQAHGSIASLLGAIQAAVWVSGEYRGYGTIDTVTEEGGEGFEDYSRIAMRLALQAAQLDPTDPHPLVLGQGPTRIFDRKKVLEWAELWQERDPWNYAGWYMLLGVLDWRWLGEEDDLQNIASHLAHNAPEGSPALAVSMIALAITSVTYRTFGELSYPKVDEIVWLSPQGQQTVATAFERLVPHIDITDPLGFLMVNWLVYGTSMACMPQLSVKLWEMMDGKLAVGLWGIRGEDSLETAIKAREDAYRQAYIQLHPLPEDNR